MSIETPPEAVAEPGAICATLSNVKNGMIDPERIGSIVNWLIAEENRPDVAVLAEAYRFDEDDESANGNLELTAELPDDNGYKAFVEVEGEDANHRLLRALRVLDANGYEVLAVEQELEKDDRPEGDGKRPDAHGIMMIAKRERLKTRGPESMHVVRLAGRCAIVAEMVDQETGEEYITVGHHGNDIGEDERLADNAALAKIITDERGELRWPIIVLTAANTMERKGLMPHLLWMAGPVVRMKWLGPLRNLKWLQPVPPNPKNPPKGLKRYLSVAQRLSSMAKGTTYKAYEKLGLRNADPTMEPTLAQIRDLIKVKTDHLLLSKEFKVLNHAVKRIRGTEDVGNVSVTLSHAAVTAKVRLGYDEPEQEILSRRGPVRTVGGFILDYPEED